MVRRRTRRERSGRGKSFEGSSVDPLGMLLALRIRPVSPLRSSVLREIEDRRVFHPERADRPALSISRRSDARSVVKSSAATKLRNDISARIGFAVPSKVITCIRRKERKEVLHAYRHVGKGSASRFRRRDWRSDIDCT